jgi:hypothetical protein
VSLRERFIFKTWNEASIPVYELLPLSKFRADDLNVRFRKMYDIKNERRPADSRYNCHGLTFIGKLGSIGIQDTPDLITLINGDSEKKAVIPNDKDVIETILKDNFFRKIKRLKNIDVDYLSGDEDIKIGDIAVYKASLRGREQIEHTALIVKLVPNAFSHDKFCDIIVLSKMHLAGEYFHPYKKVPVGCGTIIEFWTDREII